jgi:hypothetical protein
MTYKYGRPTLGRRSLSRRPINIGDISPHNSRTRSPSVQFTEDRTSQPNAPNQNRYRPPIRIVVSFHRVTTPIGELRPLPDRAPSPIGLR